MQTHTCKDIGATLNSSTRKKYLRGYGHEDAVCVCVCVYVLFFFSALRSCVSDNAFVPQHLKVGAVILEHETRGKTGDQCDIDGETATSNINLRRATQWPQTMNQRVSTVWNGRVGRWGYGRGEGG